MIAFCIIPVLISTYSLLDAEENSAMDEDGRAFGFLMVGFTSLFQVLMIHYYQLLIMQSNFDWPWLGFFIFSIIWFWVVAALADISAFSYYYKSIFTNLFKSPLFYMQCICGIGFAMIPIYAWMKYRQFFGGDPRHDIAYKAKFHQEKALQNYKS